jgi:hypothetical protein
MKNITLSLQVPTEEIPRRRTFAVAENVVTQLRLISWADRKNNTMYWLQLTLRIIANIEKLFFTCGENIQNLECLVGICLIQIILRNRYLQGYTVCHCLQSAYKLLWASTIPELPSCMDFAYCTGPIYCAYLSLIYFLDVSLPPTNISFSSV